MQDEQPPTAPQPTGSRTPATTVHYMGDQLTAMCKQSISSGPFKVPNQAATNANVRKPTIPLRKVTFASDIAPIAKQPLHKITKTLQAQSNGRSKMVEVKILTVWATVELGRACVDLNIVVIDNPYASFQVLLGLDWCNIFSVKISFPIRSLKLNLGGGEEMCVKFGSGSHEMGTYHISSMPTDSYDKAADMTLPPCVTSAYLSQSYKSTRGVLLV